MNPCLHNLQDLAMTPFQRYQNSIHVNSDITHLRPTEEYRAKFRMIRAEVRWMCFVTGPSFGSWRANNISTMEYILWATQLMLRTKKQQTDRWQCMRQRHS